MPGIRTVNAPNEGLWRVARAADLYAPREPPAPLYPGTPDSAISNRYESAQSDYRVLYFATERRGCYGETLAALRPAPDAKAAADEDGYMPFGQIPADWRNRRLAVRVSTPEDRPFVDAEAASTRGVLRRELAWLLPTLDLEDIDVAAIRGRDRRLTRWISEWVWHLRGQQGAPNYAGLRFCSRLETSWELWAVFEDTPLTECERRSVLRQDEELQAVAELFELEIF